jgi:hypothetical protein
MSSVPTVLKPAPRQQTPAPRPITPQHPVSVLRQTRAPAQMEFQFHRLP